MRPRRGRGGWVLGLGVAGVLAGLVLARRFPSAPAVRPNPRGFLDRCPYEARENLRQLGFAAAQGYAFPGYLQPGPSVSPVSERSVERGGALNLKPGPVVAHLYPFGNARFLRIAGTAMTTRLRVYVQFDRLELPDGSWLPICGAAASSLEDVYGIPTREGVVLPDVPVDPARVDAAPGSVVLNDPQFMAVLEPPDGEVRVDIRQVDPDAPPRLSFPGAAPAREGE